MRDNRKSDNRETIKWDPFARVYIYILRTNRTLNSWYRLGAMHQSRFLDSSRGRRTRAAYIYTIRIFFFALQIFAGWHRSKEKREENSRMKSTKSIFGESIIFLLITYEIPFELSPVVIIIIFVFKRIKWSKRKEEIFASLNMYSEIYGFTRGCSFRVFSKNSNRVNNRYKYYETLKLLMYSMNLG